MCVHFLDFGFVFFVHIGFNGERGVVERDRRSAMKRDQEIIGSVIVQR